MKENNTVAVFIDAENISNKYAKQIFDEASNYGEVIVKRIFADWSVSANSSWIDEVSKFSLVPEQQFSHVKGKNSSDISLIINVMKVLFEKNIDVFCLASSDSDFSRLVQELRERGKKVVGLGETKTAQSFVNAFSEFIYLNNKEPKPVEEPIVIKPASPIKGKNPIAPKQKKNQIDISNDKLEVMRNIIDTLVADGGKAMYSQIANDMKNKFADFLPKNYGCSSFKQLMEKLLEQIGGYAIETGKDGLSLFLIPKK